MSVSRIEKHKGEPLYHNAIELEWMQPTARAISNILCIATRLSSNA